LPSHRQRSSVECGRPRRAAASLVVNILATVICVGCVDPQSAIANTFPFRSVVASGRRGISCAGLVLGGSTDFMSGATADATAQIALCRMSTFRWIEVWLDICELQDGNPASRHKVSRVTDAPKYDAEVYRRSRFLIEFRHGTTATATRMHNPRAEILQGC
jgi:hypothetical protein